jgi:5'-nucleotidase
MTLQRRKKVLVDMDETICQFMKAYNMKKLLNPEIKYPQSQYGFFLDLEPIPGAIDALKTLMEEYDVYILTRPSYLNPLCYTEKRVWIEKNFGIEFCERLIMCCDKSMVKGDYLIDDLYHEGFEGEQIMIGSEKYRTWAPILEYLMPK